MPNLTSHQKVSIAEILQTSISVNKCRQDYALDKQYSCSSEVKHLLRNDDLLLQRKIIDRTKTKFEKVFRKT